MIEFLDQLLGTWMGVWEGFRRFLESFAHFGIGDGSSRRAKWAVSEYGERSSTPTTRTIGALYVVGKNIPTFVVLYLLSRYKFDKIKSVISAAAIQATYLFLTISILNIKPSPLEEYEKFAHGPIAVLSSIREMFFVDPVEAFTVWIVIFGSFFLFSFLMWYSINFVLWMFTLTYREKAIFGTTSAKGHALWMTIIWIFFLTMDSAGTAFIQALFVLIAIILNRSWKQRDISLGGSDDSPKIEMTDDVELEAEGPQEESSESSSDSTGQISWE